MNWDVSVHRLSTLEYVLMIRSDRPRRLKLRAAWLLFTRGMPVTVEDMRSLIWTWCHLLHAALNHSSDSAFIELKASKSEQLAIRI